MAERVRIKTTLPIQEVEKLKTWALERQTTVTAIIRQLIRYGEFIEGDYRDRFAELWKRYDILRGKTVTLIQGARTVKGIATGIDAESALLLRREDGRTERFRAGEVTLGKDGA